MDRNNSQNYWSMLVFQNLGALIHNKDKFRVFCFRSATHKNIEKFPMKEFEFIVTEIVKMFIKNIFELIYGKTDKYINLNLKDDFKIIAKELEILKNSESGIVILSALQEIYNHIYIENKKIKKMKFEIITNEDSIINTREKLYTKMVSSFEEIQKEKIRKEKFSLQKEKNVLFKHSSSKSYGYANNKKKQNEISMKIHTHDSRKIMNEVLNDFYNCNETSMSSHKITEVSGNLENIPPSSSQSDQIDVVAPSSSFKEKMSKRFSILKIQQVIEEQIIKEEEESKILETIGNSTPHHNNKACCDSCLIC